MSPADFVDLTGDGKKEAIIYVSECVSAGSTGCYETTFVYDLENKRPKKIWSFTTGSESRCSNLGTNYEGGKINFELIGDCEYKKGSFENKDVTSDIEAFHTTKLTFEWNGQTFIEKNRQVINLNGLE